MDTEDLFAERAARGDERGADVVLAGARRIAASDPIGPGTSTPSAITRRFAVAATAIVALSLLAMVIGSRSADAPSITSTGDRTLSAPPLAAPSTDPRLGDSAFDEEARERLQAQIEDGWVPYGNEATVAGVTTPEESWVEVDPSGLPIFEKDHLGDTRFRVHAAPRGEVIGYSYGELGFIPAELADRPDFDAGTLRIEAYGCDYERDRECALKRIDEISGH